MSPCNSPRSTSPTALHCTRNNFLIIQLAGVVCFGLTIPVAAVIAERVGESIAETKAMSATAP